MNFSFEPFLKLVACDIFNRYQNDLEHVCIVFPTRRSILYFYKYLSEIIDKPLWSPQCITISDFYKKYSSLQLANEIQLIAELYNVYIQILHTNEDFDSFYFWGDRILSDFDDIDKYRVDFKVLFENIANYKEINELFSYLTQDQIKAIQQFWTTFSNVRNSKEYQEFIRLWKVFPEIYTQYQFRLREKGIAYEGMICRQVIDDIENEKIQFPDFNVIAFVGFNALNACDKSLFSYFKKNNYALFYWDYNDLIVRNIKHEAAYFISKNLHDFPSALSDKYFKIGSKPKVEVIEVPSNVGQTKLIEPLFNKLNLAANNLENTAIVLSDESLLMPLLHALPITIEHVNITMGYSLKETLIFSLISLVGKLHLTDQKDEGFHYRLVCDILNHPYIQRLASIDANKLLTFIMQHNLILVTQNHITTVDNKLVNLLFQPIGTFNDFLDCILNILDYINQQLYAENNDEDITEQPIGIEKESISTTQTTVVKFRSTIDSVHIQLSVQLGISILLRLLSTQKIPFEGEPLRGLQIMGFLETRALDFENVIMLNVNEGYLPRSRTDVSFIPYHLRHGFSMPTLEHHDAVYAYYFYRLLFRSKNLFLLFNSSQTTMLNSERSRYISQLIFESNQYVHNEQSLVDSIMVKPLTFYLSNIFRAQIIVNKSDIIYESILQLLTNTYISPSLVFDFIECNLRFYFKYIAKLKPKKQLKEQIDGQLLGIILHNSLKKIYEPFKNIDLNDEILSNIQKSDKIYAIIDHEIKANYSNLGDDILKLSGKDLITREVIKKQIELLINIDQKFIPFKIVDLEKELVMPILITIGLKTIDLNIGGRFDRIDEINGSIRIVDYKTGKVNDLKIDFIENIFDSTLEIKDRKEKLQGILYPYIYQKYYALKSNVYSYFYLLRNTDPNSGFMYSRVSKRNIENIIPYMDSIEINLINRIKDIVNKDMPFMQTPVEDRCDFCDYKSICMR